MKCTRCGNIVPDDSSELCNDCQKERLQEKNKKPGTNIPVIEIALIILSVVFIFIALPEIKGENRSYTNLVIAAFFALCADGFVIYKAIKNGDNERWTKHIPCVIAFTAYALNVIFLPLTRSIQGIDFLMMFPFFPLAGMLGGHFVTLALSKSYAKKVLPEILSADFTKDDILRINDVFKHRHVAYELAILIKDRIVIPGSYSEDGIFTSVKLNQELTTEEIEEYLQSHPDSKNIISYIQEATNSAIDSFEKMKAESKDKDKKDKDKVCNDAIESETYYTNLCNSSTVDNIINEACSIHNILTYVQPHNYSNYSAEYKTFKEKLDTIGTLTKVIFNACSIAAAITPLLKLVMGIYYGKDIAVLAVWLIISATIWHGLRKISRDYKAKEYFVKNINEKYSFNPLGEDDSEALVNMALDGTSLSPLIQMTLISTMSYATTLYNYSLNPPGIGTSSSSSGSSCSSCSGCSSCSSCSSCGGGCGGCGD